MKSEKVGIGPLCERTETEQEGMTSLKTEKVRPRLSQPER